MTQIRLTELVSVVHINDGETTTVLATTGDWSDGWSTQLIESAMTMLRAAGVHLSSEADLWALVSTDYACDLIIGPSFTPGALVAVIAPRFDGETNGRPLRPRISHPTKFPLYSEDHAVALAFWPLPNQSEIVCSQCGGLAHDVDDLPAQQAYHIRLANSTAARALQESRGQACALRRILTLLGGEAAPTGGET